MTLLQRCIPLILGCVFLMPVSFVVASEPPIEVSVQGLSQ